MNIIKADNGKVFRRIADGQIYGNEIYLGYSYYINGVKLDEPHLDTAEDFEQIDDPQVDTIEDFEQSDESQLDTVEDFEQIDLPVNESSEERASSIKTNLGGIE